jgi:DNA-directed RNA polymerase specialized sigma24 family protein
MSKSNEKEFYFGKNEELAVVEYLKLGKYVPDVTDHRYATRPERANKLWVGTDEEAKERERIFNTHLREPLGKMVDLIMKRYQLNMRGLTNQELLNDTFGDIALKMHKFKPSKNKKAYSYYGTIIKRYLINEIRNANTSNHKHDEFDQVIETLEEKDEHQYIIDEDTFDVNALIKNLIAGIEEEMDDSDLASDEGLTPQERAIGNALITIFNNKETVTDLFAKGNKPSKKYDRMVIFEIIKGYTGLTAIEIREGIKRYRSLYDIVKHIEVNKKQNG